MKAVYMVLCYKTGEFYIGSSVNFDENIKYVKIA
jgi:predicted GIY-YIG superfamily endonuclease